MKTIVAIGLMAVAVAVPVKAADVSSGQLDKSFQGLVTFRIGSPTGDVDLIRSAVVQSAKDEPRRADLETRLIQVLRDQATWEAKDFACRQLFVIGTATGVPALSNLLQDPRLSYMARSVLEKVPGEAATQALRKALAAAKTDAIRIGCIHSLGRRGDAKSIDAFIPYSRSDRPDVAEAAILALARFDEDKAIDAVMSAYASAVDKTRSAAADAMLTVAARQRTQGKADKARTAYERLYQEKGHQAVRVAAMQGLVSMGGDRAAEVLFGALADKDGRMQASAISALRGSTSISMATLSQGMAKVPASVQPMVILALADRGPEARPFVLQAVQSKDPAVRQAAAQVLGSVGDVASVVLLAEIAASKDGAAEAARTSLIRLADPGVNAAIVSQMKTAGPEVKVELANALAGRRATETTPALLDLAGSDDPQVRRAGFMALKRLAGGQQAGLLANLLLRGLEGTEAEEAEAATVAACRGIDDPAKQGAPVIEAYPRAQSGRAKASLIRVMGKLGCKEAMAIVQTAAGDADKAVKEAAVRALVEWPDAGPIQAVRRLAESADEPTHRILALRGFIRMIDQAKLAEAEVLGEYKAALKMATRPDEKKQVMARIANLPSEEAMQIVQSFMNDPALAGDAQAAVEKIDKALKKPAQCTASTEADVDKAVDGDPATRWTTGSPMQGGEWFMLDMGKERTIKKVILDCGRSDGDYPRGYEVYISNSMVGLGQPVAKGKGDGPLTEIAFPPVSGRYVKIVQTGKVEGLYWSIHELRVE